ncbi:hypothetical protein [Sphaerisporangium dianthi]|uniref:Uncharacterized protein n=1 Tax=Sphaerisporangium dianthi TaxID=1436120 RepID=A0ABV9CQD1_9ACTN
MLVLWFRTQRVAVFALYAVILLVIVVLSFPVWLILPFTGDGRKFILDLIEKFTKWSKTVLEGSASPALPEKRPKSSS